MGKKKRVRPLAICVFRRQYRILVMEGYDALKKEYFYRPLGGRIEFGEIGSETICRELMEELNVEVDRSSLKLLGALENIFTFNGKPGHEVVLIYDGLLKERGLYDQPEIVGQDVDGKRFRATWNHISEFGEGQKILYPNGLLEMLIKEIYE